MFETGRWVNVVLQRVHSTLAQTSQPDFPCWAKVVAARQVYGIGAAVKLTADIAPYVSGYITQFSSNCVYVLGLHSNSDTYFPHDQGEVACLSVG